MTLSGSGVEAAEAASAPACRPLGHRRFIRVLIASAVLCLCVGFAAAFLVKVPAQVAEAKAPAAGLISAPLTKRPSRTQWSSAATPRTPTAHEVTVSPSGASGVPAIATGHIPVVGQVLQAGPLRWR